MGKESKKTEAITNESSPLTLHHYDHPSLVLISKLLEGDNYRQWSRAMRIALSAKNKIGFINKTVNAQSLTDPKFPNWERFNHMYFLRF